MWVFSILNPISFAAELSGCSWSIRLHGIRHIVDEVGSLVAARKCRQRRRIAKIFVQRQKAGKHRWRGVEISERDSEGNRRWRVRAKSAAILHFNCRRPDAGLQRHQRRVEQVHGDFYGVWVAGDVHRELEGLLPPVAARELRRQRAILGISRSVAWSALAQKMQRNSQILIANLFPDLRPGGAEVWTNRGGTDVRRRSEGVQGDSPRFCWLKVRLCAN